MLLLKEDTSIMLELQCHTLCTRPAYFAAVAFWVHIEALKEFCFRVASPKLE